MSPVDAPPSETKKKTNPVGTQEVSPGEDEAKAKQAEFDAAVKDAVAHQFDVKDTWQPKIIVKFIIEFPGGQKALVKHLDTMDLMNADLIEELDFFTKRLFPSQYDDQGNPIEAVNKGGIWATLRDPQKRLRFLDMTNRLMMTASIKPRIVNDMVAVNDSDEIVFGYQIKQLDEQIKLFGKPVPELKKGEAYAGPIEFSDRMLFFNELNKPLEVIQPFREEPDALLENLERSKSSGVQTK